MMGRVDIKLWDKCDRITLSLDICICKYMYQKLCLHYWQLVTHNQNVVDIGKNVFSFPKFQC